MNRFLLNASYLLFLLLPSNSFSQALPTEIDYISAQKKYELGVVKSSAARLDSDAALNILNENKSSIDYHEKFIADSRNIVASNEYQIISLSDEIQSLTLNISNLESLNRNLVHEIDSLGNVSRGLESRISQKRNELVRPVSDRNQITVSINDVERDLRNLSQLKNEKERSFDKALRELTRAQKSLDSLESEAISIRRDLPELRARIKDYESDIIEARRDLTQAKNEKERLQSRRNSLKQELENLESKLKESEQKLAQIKSEISPLTAKLRELKNAKQSIQGEIASNESSISSLKDKLETLKSQRQTLPEEISKLKRKISNVQDEISRARDNESQANSELSRVNSEYDSIGSEIDRLRTGPVDDATRAKLASLRDQQKSLSSRRMSLQSSIRQYASEQTQLTSQISRIESEIASNERALSNLVSNISQTKDEIKGLENKHDTLVSRRQSINSDIDSTNSQISQYDSRISSLEQEVSSNKNDVSRKSEEFKSVKNELERANSQITSSESKVRDSELAITNTRARISQLQDRLEGIKNDVSRANSDIAQAQRESAQAQREISDLENRISRFEGDKNRLERDLYNVNSVIASLERDLNELLNNYRQTESQLASLNSRLSDNRNTISQNRATIQRNESEVISLRQEILSSNKNIASSTVQLGTLEKQLIINQSVFDQKNSEALKLETITMDNYEIYMSKLSLYKTHEADAKKIGLEQAILIAREQGTLSGEAYVLEKAVLIGSTIGEEIGSLDGELRGLLEGLSRGTTVGYEDGVNSEDDFELGRIDGYKLGLLKATELAKEQEIPRGHDDFVSKLLKSKKEARSLEKAMFTSTVEDRILKIQKLLESFEDPATSMSRAEFSYTSPRSISVDTSRKNCSLAYKNTSSLVAVCNASYDQSFKANFAAAHREVYFEQYESIYQINRSKAFEANKNKKFDEAYAVSYDYAYLNAKAEGGKVAFQNGFEEGETSGFSENIDLKRAHFFKEGQAVAQAFYLENALVRFDSRQGTSVRALSEKGLIQGSSFELGLTLLNFSDISSREDSIVAQIVRTSNNISLKKQKVSIKSVSGKSKMNILDLFEGSVNEDALPGSEILITVKITYPKNGIGIEESETVSFLEKVRVNPEVKTAAKFSSKVEWRDWKVWPLKWVYRSHEIKVNLTGLRNNVPGSYDVELEILKGGSYVKVSTPKVKAPAPGKDQVSQAVIKYTFKKDAKDQDLSFRIKISYEGELVSQEMVNIKVD